MDVYSCVAILTWGIAAMALWKFRKRKDYQYSTLDTAGIILNTVLILMIYPPMCLGCGLMVTEEYYENAPNLMERASIVLSSLMPSLCVAGVAASVVLRRKEKPVWSFAVQFVGAIFCGIIMLIAL